MQGRFKRDGSASAEPEPHGGTDRGSSPQHAQNPGPAPSGGVAERPGRTGVPAAPTPPSAPTPPKTTAPVGPGPRIALRNWRISTRLVSLLALPVVAATSLGALRISDNVDQIQQLDNMKLLTEMTKQATQLAQALQEERDQSAGPLSHGASASDYTVKGVRDRTNRARQSFLEGAQQVDDSASSGDLTGVTESLTGIASELSNLSAIRSSAFKDSKNSTQTVEAYHRLITGLLSLSQDMAEATSNPEMISRTRALAAFSTAKEYASVQRAVIAAALPASNTTPGDLSENDRQYALSALDSQESELESFRGIYGDGAEQLTKPVDQGSPTIEAANKYADRVLKSSAGMKSQDKRSYKDWVDDDSAKIEQMRKIEGTLLEEMEQKARELRSASEREAIISGALILLVLGVSLVGAFVVARSMIRSLRRLQETATKVAQDRLPELVKQLSESDPQDVDTSVESVGVHSRDEIGQVAAAFDDVHREAVRLAAEQALLRGNVNAMFTNLSRRSQGLIQRQLSLISELESREADPDQLSSLFKLDHLATRMRRNGENLLVLAGEEPGRRWTRPVPLVDVLRAAASEVEQYERIELAAVPTTEVAGRVVNDLVHLLAELLENATSFSSPQTKVKVTGHALPDGRVLIEIHDTGIGLSPEDLAAINERLAAPPTVDVSVSRRMGLFVVGRLSQRHGIRIQLRPSDSGGTTALVMLPVDVAQGGKKPTPGKPGQGAPQSGGPAAAQAAAGVAAARRQAQQSGSSFGTGSTGGPGLGAAPQRGQVGAGQGPRAALPGSGQGGRPGAPRGPQGPAAPQQGRPAPAGAGAGAGAFGQGGPQGLQGAQAFQDTGSRQGGFGDGGSGTRQGGFGDGGAPTAVPPQSQQQPKEGRGRRRPQLPGRGGARAELPGGNPQQRTPSWSDENAQPSVPRASLDTPRGHEEPDALSTTSPMPRIDDRQGPASTSEFPRPDFNDPRPGAGAQDNGGQFVRSDIFGSANQGGSTGQFPAPSHVQNTGQFPAPGHVQDTGQFPAPGHVQDTGQFPAVGRGQDTGQFPAVGRGQDTGQFPAAGHVQNTGQFPAVGHVQNTGQFPAVGRGQDTGQFPAAGHVQNTGQFPTPGHAQDPSSTGQFAAQGYNGSGTGQFAAPGYGNHQDPSSTGQFERPQVGGDGYGASRPPAPQPPRRQEPEALPPAANPGDGRTPLFDTLETNWFRGGQQQGNGSAPQAPQQQAPAAHQRPAANAAWRTSPNDELVRQAERVRQPAAGGITTSGLPRRVPRANLVPGTAQQQQHHAGPQVSRAPDDVRGRLTNLRRGIAQGRQAGTGQTGSFPSPTHQQER
ncbi:nitrate- and nitrite sensing domain-containing protein [Streptomyces yaanensis]|uniref:histidine kinase n=1 Tax=Streptomyces yaanensis TaxID=1142239 RepID=A0ABV7SGH6_9ACTN|nr:nitrate- and nitrite sensing domain-containing protein [Streptomyces sp. CGMCC 4.7035]WNB97997.1 nitrate- and nitrite sensing domain-containing protein [Streptomyces sp. CGMCC 4.7035]